MERRENGVRPAALPPLALAYHGIDDVPLRRDRHGLFVRPAAFRRHVALLERWGYRFVRFGELAERAADGSARGFAALTFDDGLRDNLTTLLPLLEELSVPATVFVTTGWLGATHPDAPWARILSADDVRSLDRAGVEIGAHTVTHPNLRELDPGSARDEWAGSRATLEEIVDAPVEVAAYPYGFADDDAADAAAAAGLRAVGTLTPDGSWSDPYRLPRQAIVNDSTLLGLRLKRDDRYERLMGKSLPRALRKVKRVAQRVVR